ncbi:MAG: response regulator [Lachnospiraceae bacterium]|nr:response regulator [Lachnospiraceae bacterium]
MKKVFFIGKFNKLFEEISDYLANFFNVQVCVDNLYMMQSLLKLSQPDLFVISMIGIGEDRSKILNELKYNYSNVPLISLEAPSDSMSEDELTDIKQYRTITMPVDNEKLVEIVCELLSIKYDADNKVVSEERYERKCILAIDDNAFQLRMLNELLKDKYDIQLATSAMKALTLIGKRVPDIIILDYEMPICDGKMTLQMIRAIEEAKDVPVIFLTGVRDTEHIKAVIDLHPAGYLLKPANGNMIIEEIEKHLK